MHCIAVKSSCSNIMDPKTDFSNRFCCICGSKESSGDDVLNWYRVSKEEGMFECSKCHRRRLRLVKGK
jgi:hypothetical protein